MRAQEIGKPLVVRSAIARHRGTLVVLAATLVTAMGRPASSRLAIVNHIEGFARAQRD
jgi:hypothetical protein